MKLTTKYLKQIIKEECAAMADSQGLPDAYNKPTNNVTITGSPDHEIAMAHKQLNKAAKYSQSLASRMENMPEANLPSWVQAKITKASDYISIVYHYLEEELNPDHDADAIVSIEKQPVNESWEMLSDPTTLTLGTAGLIFLYYKLFGKKPDPEADLDRVRKEIEMLVTRSQMPPGPSAGTTKQREDDTFQSSKRKLHLRQMKKDRGISS